MKLKWMLRTTPASWKVAGEKNRFLDLNVHSIKSAYDLAFMLFRTSRIGQQLCAFGMFFSDSLLIWSVSIK